MSEPRPAPHSHDDVPDNVLEELRVAFGEPAEGRGEPPARGDSPAGTADTATETSVTVPLGSIDAAAPTVPMREPDDATAGVTGMPDAPGDGTTGSWTVAVPDDTEASGMAPGVPGGQVDEVPGPDAGPDAGPDTGSGRPDPARSTIVIGGDDDLPDAIYLDEATDRTGDGGSGRGTIVIGDELDSAGVFDAVEVPSRSMDPRLRERRIAVKRAAGRRRLIWVSAVTATLLVVVAVIAVFASSLFAVEVVDVQGAVYTADRNGEQLQAVIDAMMGDPVLLVDTLAAQEALERIPWVERALVYTDFPDRVVIDIRERRPFATFVGSDQRYRVIDRDGRVLDVLDGRPVDYMLISGAGPDLEPGSMSGTRFAQASQMIGALPAELRVMTESVSVDATTGELSLALAGPSGPIEVRVGTFDALDAKLARLLQQVRDGLDDVERIDVSSDDIVISRTPQV